MANWVTSNIALNDRSFVVDEIVAGVNSIPDEHSEEKITHWISNGSEKGALKR